MIAVVEFSKMYMVEPVVMEIMGFPEDIRGLEHSLYNNLARPLPPWLTQVQANSV